jgi:hypothetical protein
MGINRKLYEIIFFLYKLMALFKICVMFIINFWYYYVSFLFFYLWLYHPCWVLTAFSVSWSFYTFGRTSWTGDQPVARPLPAHKSTHYIHVSSEIRTHDTSVSAGEDISCIRPRGHCDRHVSFHVQEIKHMYSFILTVQAVTCVSPIRLYSITVTVPIDTVYCRVHVPWA